LKTPWTSCPWCTSTHAPSSSKQHESTSRGWYGIQYLWHRLLQRVHTRIHLVVAWSLCIGMRAHDGQAEIFWLVFDARIHDHRKWKLKSFTWSHLVSYNYQIWRWFLAIQCLYFINLMMELLSYILFNISFNLQFASNSLIP